MSIVAPEPVAAGLARRAQSGRLRGRRPGPASFREPRNRPFPRPAQAGRPVPTTQRLARKSWNFRQPMRPSVVFVCRARLPAARRRAPSLRCNPRNRCPSAAAAGRCWKASLPSSCAWQASEDRGGEAEPRPLGAVMQVEQTIPKREPSGPRLADQRRAGLGLAARGGLRTCRVVTLKRLAGAADSSSRALQYAMASTAVGVRGRRLGSAVFLIARRPFPGSGLRFRRPSSRAESRPDR